MQGKFQAWTPDDMQLDVHIVRHGGKVYLPCAMLEGMNIVHLLPADAIDAMKDEAQHHEGTGPATMYPGEFEITINWEYIESHPLFDGEMVIMDITTPNGSMLSHLERLDEATGGGLMENYVEKAYTAMKADLVWAEG